MWNIAIKTDLTAVKKRESQYWPSIPGGTKQDPGLFAYQAELFGWTRLDIPSVTTLYFGVFHGTTEEPKFTLMEYEPDTDESGTRTVDDYKAPLIVRGVEQREGVKVAEAKTRAVLDEISRLVYESVMRGEDK